MTLSPLQLEGYFLTDLSFQADHAHDPAKPIQFHEDDLVVETGMVAVPNEERRWQITLKIRLQPRPESNSPYTLALTLVGFVWAAPQLPADRLDSLVRTNGPSMLYGAAREMVRDLTARGPFPPLSLPSVSFLNKPSASKPRKRQEPNQSSPKTSTTSNK